MRFWHAFRGAAAAAAFVVAQHAWAGPVVYEQAWDGTSALYGSQNDPTPGGGGNFGTVYDDFTLDRAQQLNGVQWTGGFYNPGTPGPIEAFTIQFYADAGGVPGTSLYSSRQAATATFLGYQDAVAFGPLAFYSYSMDLAFGFGVDAATRYWVSIVPDLALIGFTQQWGIARSNQGNGIAIQDFTGVRSERPDFAFSLSASDVAAVPTPGSLPLVAVALAGLLVLRRRRPAATGKSGRATMQGLPALGFGPGPADDR